MLLLYILNKIVLHNILHKILWLHGNILYLCTIFVTVKLYNILNE